MEVATTTNQLATKSCELDPLPTWLLNELCINDMAPIITSIDAAIERSNVPNLLKQAHIRPLLKRTGLDEKL